MGRERDRYTAAYERLRACVAGARGGAGTKARRAVGLGLLLQQGVAGWVAAGAGLCSAPLQDTAVSMGDGRPRLDARPYGTPAGLPPEVLPRIQQSELAYVMANLVLSTRRTERSPSVGLAGCAHPETEGLACR